MTDPRVRITVDGELALTVGQAAARYGVGHSTMSANLARRRVPPDAQLDGKKRLYLASRLDAIMESGRRRSRRDDVDDATILKLRDQRGLSWAAIAAEVGMSPTGIRTRYRVARGWRWVPPRRSRR